MSLPETSPVGKEWVCPGCTTRTRKGDNTPVRATPQNALAPRAAAPRVATVSLAAATAALAPTAVAAAPAPAAVAAAPAPAAPPLELQDMHREIAEWMLEMREFRREMSEFRVSIRGLAERVDTIEERLVAVEQREESPSAVADLRCKVAMLQQELNDRDQEALLSDLEIGHLPEERGENVVHSVTVLAAKLGVALEERDIVFAERVGVTQIAGAAGAPPPTSRRVVVRLARRHLRDQILQGARVRRTLTAADAAHAAATATTTATAAAGPRIFVNERLTRTNRQVFHRVREECRRAGWKYSWTRRGRIYARQSDGKPAYPIRSEADVERVFGPALV